MSQQRLRLRLLTVVKRIPKLRFEHVSNPIFSLFFAWEIGLFRCGTLNVKAGEKGEGYIEKYSLIHFELVIMLTVGGETEVAKKLYDDLRKQGKHIM